MTELLQALTFGVLTGGVYALMATGLTLTFGVMKIVNMAQGALLILSAYLCWTLWAHLGIDPLLGSLIVTVPLAGLGAGIYRFIVERVRTWLGHAITAAAENPEGARLIGVEPKRIGTWIFAIATATTAFGGAALSFLYQFTPDSQDTWIGLTLSVVILGGLGSVTGAFAAGVLLGLAESATSTYISVRWSEAVPTILILVVLLIRPQGLFTLAARQDAAA